MTFLSIDGTIGQEIDFANSRPGTGTTINLQATLHPTNHLNVDLVENQRWVNVECVGREPAAVHRARVAAAQHLHVHRAPVRAGDRAYVVDTRRPVALHRHHVAPRGHALGSALLAYKLNWQSVMFVGYGDDRELLDLRRLEKVDRQIFIKLSYAFQR